MTAAVRAGHVFEQRRGAALGEQPRLDLGHLQHRRDRVRHADEAAGLFEGGDEIAQRVVRHARTLTRRFRLKKRPECHKVG